MRVSPLLSHRLGLVSFVNEANLGSCVYYIYSFIWLWFVLGDFHDRSHVWFLAAGVVCYTVFENRGKLSNYIQIYQTYVKRKRASLLLEYSVPTTILIDSFRPMKCIFTNDMHVTFKIKPSLIDS